ncbi:DUF2309 domain-containing protein [Pseudobacteriovorax antillogorgiicola]|uniref:Probable inorganic carbon transporter subunit DabA n=1 Tax=Pseudobacteriovorax antillogorgiicola TaxID=1513793 RepID=A0A1Y6C5H4_9BACT|nr:DUF2309 domain-containing protein [Pseudobacteriovorax antillogorgiicola]TCS49425.1 hypothetical protein EDD56_115105 [Pseudobacteriovorax antillogorgiicola]SMF46778.1 hypothetical protein SAMN06296036_11479 [Pseudobacteriovorax antillogorgiicola]
MKIIHGDARPSGRRTHPRLSYKQSHEPVEEDTVKMNPLDESLKLATPVWPLQNSVAVNPFWFKRDKHINDVFYELEAVFHQSLFMPLAYYQQRYRAGDISEKALQSALEQARQQWPEIPEAAGEFHELTQNTQEASRTFLSFAESLKEDQDIHQLVIEDLSKYCAGYFDSHQANVRYPWQSGSFWEGWFEAQRFDKAMIHSGLPSFPKTVQRFLKSGPEDAISNILIALGIESPFGQYAYLQRLLASMIGWSSQFKYLEWQRDLGYEVSFQARLVEFLAVRIIYDYAVFQEFSERYPSQADSWAHSFNEIDQEIQAPQSFHLVPYVWQLALEFSYQRRVSKQIGKQLVASSRAQAPYKIALCIDVRSEMIRRRIEKVSDEFQTMGFAGFFGAPIDFHRSHEACEGHRLPALIAPAYKLVESPKKQSSELSHAKRFELMYIFSYFKNFRKASLASFLYVELFGILAVGNLILRTWKTLAARITGQDTPARFSSNETEPCIKTAQTHDGQALTLTEKVSRCLTVLKSMGLTRDFGRLVILCGHGATTTNNALASALDCGACGGHAGDINARFMTALLNDEQIRGGLREQGIDIPRETRFVPAVHETVTDKVYLLDEEKIPALYHNDLRKVRKTLHKASMQTSKERQTARSDVLDPQTGRRADNWSEIRPEWGLAGNACFIIAPRDRTASINLGSRAFLHDYDWQADDSFKILEGIMTAPMIVTNWINMQYYGSVALPNYYGAGRKTLHNITGESGVVEGNGGDLRIGLAYESISDGESLTHEPLRLSVYIEAPEDAIESIIERHEAVRELVDHEWLHLLRIESSDGSVFRRTRGGMYRKV